MKLGTKIYLLVLTVNIVVIIGLLFGLYQNNSGLSKQKVLAASTGLELQAKTDELEALQNLLSQTEEGKKQLAEAKALSDAKASEQSDRAESAESKAAKINLDLNKARADLNKTQADLNSKKAEVDKAVADLAVKQAELAKANKCVALFASTKSLVNDHFDAIEGSNSNAQAAMDALAIGDFALADQYIDIANDYLNSASNIYTQIHSILNKVGSGNC